MKKDYVQMFIKCLEDIDRSKNKYDVFQDFLSLASLSLYNVTAREEEVEKQYQEIFKQYKNANRFVELLAITASALEQRHCDFLGEVFMRAEFGNKKNGQFFTPYHVSQLMAEITLDTEQIKQTIDSKGFISLSEPCCGAGGMIIAASEVLLKRGFNPQKVMTFQGIDIDLKCCQMAFIQTSLLGLTGAIIHGNTLTLECWKTFVTPLSMLNANFYKNKYNIISPVTNSNVIQFPTPPTIQAVRGD